MTIRGRTLLTVPAAALVGCSGSSAESPDGAIVVDAAVTPIDAAGPLRLSEMGLYDDLVADELAPGVRAYNPAYPFWVDGATKRRWLLLPEGAAIDTADMDHWRMPVGARLFKEFSSDGVRVETRVIWRTGPGDDESDYFMGSFLWDADQGEAVHVPEGAEDALGTAHDVPRAVECADCHDGEPGRVLGLSAIQLSHEGEGETLASLAAAGLIAPPPEPSQSFPVPGDATTAAALGYLHANCGHCHNPSGPAFADVDMILRLDVAERDPAAARTRTTTVGVALQRWAVEPYVDRVVAGDAAASAIVARMAIRGGGLDEMPPLGSDVVDAEGVAAVSAWITSLAP